MFFLPFRCCCLVFSFFFFWEKFLLGDEKFYLLHKICLKKKTVPYSPTTLATSIPAAYSVNLPKLQGDDAISGEARQGQAVSVNYDGTLAIVGGTRDNSALGAAWIYERNPLTNVWTQVGSKLVGSDVSGSTAFIGSSVSMSGDGNHAIVGGRCRVVL